MDTSSNSTYLCQVSGAVSCGACCGLYNLPGLSRTRLVSLLAKRTEDFAQVARTEDELYRFKQRNKGPPRLSRPFPGFHHCPFLGLVGETAGCVGCLLHPTAPGNKGVDYRSFSWYGQQACQTYFCPSTRKLPAVYQAIVTRVIDDWYVYGLIVTEHALVSAYFEEVAIRLGRGLELTDFAQASGAGQAFAAFAELKLTWSYRRDDCSGPCNYFLENGLFPRPGVLRKATGIPSSRYERIFGELDSAFSSAKELAAAETILDHLFTRTVQALGK
ncbi:MAG: hypothetical protein OEL83_14050 [Desulforhopalus sp.]|nr:hypothetical protein [Desulforhopalus sp.]